MKPSRRILIVALVCVVIGYAFWPRTNRRYVESTSGVHLPRGTEIITEYSDRETFLVMVFRLNESETAPFIAKYGFTSPGPDMYLDRFLEHLPSEYRYLPDTGQRYSMKGRIPTNTWDFVLDKKRSILWSVICYPDMAGDPP